MTFFLILRSNHEKIINALVDENKELATALEKAQRNDTPKDPKTGRFTKKCRNT